MLKRLAILLLLAGGMSLAGCGGGGKAPMLPAAPAPTASSTTPQSAKSKVSFVVTVPKSTPAPLGAHRPAYVSPATQSMTVNVMQGSNSVSNQTVGLTANSSGCTSSLADITCTLTLSLSAGSYTASLTTYDGANATGHQLSTAQNVSFTVIASQNSTVPLSLSGIPMNIVAMAGNTPNTVYVAAEDADGNYIVGSGAPTFTAAKASGSNVASITQPSSTAPNKISLAAESPAVYGSETIGVTASYPSGQTNACTVTGAVCTLATPISVTNTAGTAFMPNYEVSNLLGYSLPLANDTAAPSVDFSGVNDYPYWTMAMNSKGTIFAWGYDETYNLVITSPPYTTDTIDSNTGITYAYYYGAADSNGDVFIPDDATSIAIIKPPYTNPATQLTAGIDDPYGAAVDSSNKLYVANEGNDTITVYASPYTSPSATLTTTSSPYGIVVSGTTLFVTEDGYVDVFNLSGSSTTPTATLDMTGYSYGNAAVDPSGNLWVGCYESCTGGSDGAVYEFTSPFSNGETPTVSITSMPDGSSTTCTYVTGIGFDSAGNLFVEDGYGGTEDGCLLEYAGPASGITSSSTPKYYVNSTALDDPWGMAIAPGGLTVTP